MPVKMHQIKRGKDKGKWAARDAAGRHALKPTTKAKARAYVRARGLATARSKGHRVPARRGGG